MKLFALCLLLATNTLANIGNFTLGSEKTLYIVDGDSISMQMRIAGIDTPEIRQKCSKTQFQVIDCGRLSKNYLKKTLQNLPGELSIEPVGIDYYNRILVRVYKGDVNVGKLMVEAGMAFSYKDTYRKEEELAKEDKLGFWDFYTPPIEPYKWRKKYK
ncbi:MAG TPA: thermonuclease family protein [Piscirickettsiaceae bacterium]|jgi:endonuclease YncB( thermonuclease family)|nr:thermonuclease family protein [Piscirickettsiaceae bacterium]